MDEYLKTLQSINQSIEEVLQNSQISPEEEKFASHLSDSVQLCVDEIFESTDTLKNIVKISLEDLNKAEDILQNYFKLSREVSPSVPFEEIGKLSGHYSKILRLIEESRQKVFEQLKESWEQDFENNTKQWFFDEEGKLKKGIGWNEKDSFVKRITAINQNQFLKLQQALKNEYKIIVEQINLLINFNFIENYMQFLDNEAQKNYCDDIMVTCEKLKNSLGCLKNDNKSMQDFRLKTNFVLDPIINSKSMKNFRLKINFVLDPIINSKWGDLPWDLVLKIKSEYNEKIEILIHDIFWKKAQLITSLFEIILKFYNDFLQKQAFYNQHSIEEQQAKQEWINAQRQKLETLQNSLENVVTS